MTSTRYEFQLEERPAGSSSKYTRRQIFATVGILWSYLIYGAAVGYNAPAIHSFLDGHTVDIFGNIFIITFQQASWFSSLLSLGAFFGFASSAIFAPKVGRRILLSVSTVFFFVGHLIILLGTNVAHMYCSRFTVGLGVGGTVAIAGVYAYEMSAKEFRGLLGCSVQASITLGIVISCVLGRLVEWYALAGLSLCLLLPQWVFIKLIPESPYWLVGRGKEYSASKTIEWLHGKDLNVVDNELLQIKQEQRQRDRKKYTVSPVVLSQHWRPFLVCLSMMMVLQLCGHNVMIYYSIVIIEMTAPDLDPHVAAIVVFLLLMASYVLVLTCTYRTKRKPLLVISMAGMTVCQFAMGLLSMDNPPAVAYIHRSLGNSTVSANQTSTTSLDLQSTLAGNGSSSMSMMGDSGRDVDGDVAVGATSGFEWPELHPSGPAIQWMFVVTFCLCLVIGNLGWFSLMWVVVAEHVPREVHETANSLIVSFSFLCAFIALKSFADLVESIELDGTFYLYGTISFLGTIFTVIFVPETKAPAYVPGTV